ASRDLPVCVQYDDDPPGAILAFVNYQKCKSVSFVPAQLAVSGLNGLHWLNTLQNRDGGWPTFCRGWGHLPFDRSGPDLTAHALRAIRALAELYDRPDRPKLRLD